MAFIIVFYVASNSIFSGKGEAIFKGFIYMCAIIMIEYVAQSMLKFYNMEAKWRLKMEVAMLERSQEARKNRWTVAFLAFSATLREGIEAVLFLTGVSSGVGITSVIIPSIVGAILGLLAGWFIYLLGKSIRSLKWFFIISTFVLLLIAAGMTQNALASFQTALWFGNTWPYENISWPNRILWNTYECCNPDQNEFWSLIRALFGYQPLPTNIQLIFYVLFWACIIAGFALRLYLGVLTDKKAFEGLVDSEGRVIDAGDALDDLYGHLKSGAIYETDGTFTYDQWAMQNPDWYAGLYPDYKPSDVDLGSDTARKAMAVAAEARHGSMLGDDKAQLDSPQDLSPRDDSDDFAKLEAKTQV